MEPIFQTKEGIVLYFDRNAKVCKISNENAVFETLRKDCESNNINDVWFAMSTLDTINIYGIEQL